MDAHEVLEGLRRELQADNAQYVDPDTGPRLDFCPCEDGFRVWTFGTSFPFEALAREPVASRLVSLSIDGPDLGGNGVRNWDLSAFAEGDCIYPVLQHLRAARTAASHHNRSIVASVFDEACVLGRIAAKAPALQSLESPSAPQPNFLDAKLDNLTHLWVDAGFDTQDFIRNLAQRRLPPLLRGFEWGEYAEHYLDDWKSKTTPFTDMLEFFRNADFAQIRYFALKNPIYSDEELRELAALRPQMQVQIIRSRHAYVRAEEIWPSG
jgi:hypothetical protein